MAKIVSGINDLLTLNPSLASEFHSSKNNGLNPSALGLKSNKKVWWQCTNGHEWESTVVNRAYGNGCPFCSGRKVLPGQNDLATTHPKLAQEWHPTKNGSLTPVSVSAGAEKKVWWLGECGHEWLATIYSRAAGRGCPYCRGLKILVGFNDFASQHPELLSEWDESKNTISPYAVTSMTTKKVWWKCVFGHEWSAAIATRSKGHGCPICSLRHHTSFPEQVVYFYISQTFPDAINGFSDIFSAPMELDIYIPSIKTGIEYDGSAWHRDDKKQSSDRTKYKICQKHEIRLIRIREKRLDVLDSNCDDVITINENPPFKELDAALVQLFLLLNQSSKREINTALDETIIKSKYISVIKGKSICNTHPEIALQWHPEKNGSLTPEMVTAGSNEKVWWLCPNEHEWQATVNDRRAGYGCPFCSNQKVLPGYNDFLTDNPELAREWHPTLNGDLLPSDVTPGTEQVVWWKGNCGHEWTASVYARNRANNGCPICAGRRVLPGFNDLASQAPEIAAEWCYERNGNLTPSGVTVKSGKKVWWLCPNGHEWESAVYARHEGRKCPMCRVLRKNVK